LPDSQKEIYSMLAEISEKNIDRFFSLIEFEIVIVTLYASLAVYRLSDINEYLRGFYSLKIDIWTTLNHFFIALSIVTLIISLNCSLRHIRYVDTSKINIFKFENDLIRFKTDQELSKMNTQLVFEVDSQRANFLGSLYLVFVSITSAFVYLLPNKPPLYIVVLVLFLFYLFFIINKKYLKYDSEKTNKHIH
jgi:hypothetical protein